MSKQVSVLDAVCGFADIFMKAAGSGRSAQDQLQYENGKSSAKLAALLHKVPGFPPLPANRIAGEPPSEAFIQGYNEEAAASGMPLMAADGTVPVSDESLVG